MSANIGFDATRRTALPPMAPPIRFTAYAAHVAWGMPIRHLAREMGRNASTISRQVRKVEALRDDPLIDLALERIERLSQERRRSDHSLKEIGSMVSKCFSDARPDDEDVARDARRILRRLCESGAFLAVSPGLARAVVFRDGKAGDLVQTAVVSRASAERFACNDWISRDGGGRVARYVITVAGRAALKRFLAADKAERGDAGAPSPFAAQHQDAGEMRVIDEDGTERSVRRNMAESPLTLLARRKGADGAPFLASDEVEAGERLREDFERAHIGPRVAQDWSRFLVASSRGFSAQSDGPDGSSNARDRVAAALETLGPGLSDVALRCCCFLEGLETAERRMGWSARSGKVVLKIALQRLARFYGIAAKKDTRRAG